jgi:hypothetical protein
VCGGARTSAILRRTVRTMYHSSDKYVPVSYLTDIADHLLRMGPSR